MQRFNSRSNLRSLARMLPLASHLDRPGIAEDVRWLSPRSGALSMNARSKSATSAYSVLAAEAAHASLSKDGSCVAEVLKARLMETARERTILHSVAGGRYCAVMLDDRGVGVTQNDGAEA